MPQLDGRVFSRIQQYEALPTELKDEVSALVDYLTTSQRDVFGLHHANIIKTVRSVRAKPMTEKITAWLLQKESLTTASASAAETAVVEPETAAVVELAAVPSTETVVAEKQAATEETTTTTETPAAASTSTEDEAAKAKEAALKAKEDAAAKAKADADAAAARLAHAKELLEALVLKGFVTPYKEGDKPVNAPATETFNFKDSELLIPIAPEVAAEPAPTSTTVAAAPASTDASVSNLDEASAAPSETTASTTTTTTTTVWDLVDGAVFAATLKRKAGLFAPLTQGKDVYVVVNARLKSVVFFETDLAREPIVSFGVAGTSVAFDKTHFALGVKVWNETLTELLNAATKLEREALVHALIALGLTYYEELDATLQKVETIYELTDTDIDGQDVALSKYTGKVLLVVNVSSACGLTPTNYPELVTLHEKYGAQGLEVLAFPCNQFMGQEPGTHDEIKAFVKQYNATFPFFSKGDVNGVDTRPVFAFLKHKLPATYIQWNFTKFLVDRQGKPVKRFGPMEKPLSFEDEIVKLLAKDVTVVASETTETVAETAAVAMATETVAETVTETVTEPAPAVVAEPAPAVVAAPAVMESAPAAVVEPVPVAVVEPAVVEPTPEAAPAVEEVKAAAPVEVEKPAEPVKVEEAPVETKVEAVAPAPAVEEPKSMAPKVEDVKTEAAPAASAVVESTPVMVEEVAVEPSVPVQGFTVGNEPTTAP